MNYFTIIMKRITISGAVNRLSSKTQHFPRNYPLRTCSKTVQDAKPYKSIPGLSSLPLLGPLHHFLPVIGEFGPKGNFIDMAGVLYKRYGSVVRMGGMFGRPDIVMLFDPDHIGQVFRSQESNPLRRGFQTLQYYREVLRKDVFEGIYGLSTAQGAQWRDFRTKVNPALLKIKLVKVYAKPLEEIAEDFVERLKRLRSNKAKLSENFHTEVNKWSLESIALVGLGARIGCLEDNLPLDHPARILMKCARDIIDLTFQLEFLPNPWKYIATPGYKKIIKTYETQWDVSAIFIEQARNRINERGHDIPEEDKSIIEKLLAIDEKVANMMANEMLLAGIDTAAFTVTSLLYQLATNQEKQEKLRKEIRSNDSHNRYLKACIKEGLRIWPVLPANLRTSDKDHIVGGYHIPPGVDIVGMNEFLSRLETYYPRPNEFIPERWLADKTDPLYYGNAHPMVTLPFGFGIRSCIGRRIAELEMETLVKKLIDEFQVTWEGPPLKVVNTLLNTLVKPFNFKFEDAK